MSEWLTVIAWIVVLRLLPSKRKLIHVVVGLSVVPLAIWIHHWYVAAVPLALIFSANARTNLVGVPTRSTLWRMYAIFGVAAPLVLFLYLWKQGRTDIAVAAVLVMSFGDVAAAYGGRAFGANRFPWNGKSLEGAICNLLVSFTTLFLLTNQMQVSLTGAFTASIIEAIVPGIWDNPAVLMSTALLLFASLR